MDMTTLPDRFAYIFRKTWRDSRWHYSWIVCEKGTKEKLGRGAVEIQASQTDSMGLRWLGGVEVHYTSRPDYMRDTPSNERCAALGGLPCWHDGSATALDRYQDDLDEFLRTGEDTWLWGGALKRAEELFPATLVEHADGTKTWERK